jgi:hypothetical protein
MILATSSSPLFLAGLIYLANLSDLHQNRGQNDDDGASENEIKYSATAAAVGRRGESLPTNGPAKVDMPPKTTMARIIKP